MNRERAIRSIAVAGDGIVGLTAALAFAVALPDASVTVIETTPDPRALADAFPVALASGRVLHAMIGIDEPDLVRSGIASHHLGTLFEGWSASGEAWWLVLGDYGKPANAIPFDHLWLRARIAGHALPYDRYAVGAALARTGKFVQPAADPQFIGSRFDYGLRLDPKPYRAALRALAEARGIAFRAAAAPGAERRPDGAIAALGLDNGERVEADLFVDCTGPSATIAGPGDDSFEDWSRWLPCRHMTVDVHPSGDVPPPADRARADARGWSGEWPLRRQTLALRLTAEQEGRSGMGLTFGRRLRPWAGNVLALGDAATALDPLHHLNLDLAHRAILLALELLPDRDFHPVETAEYNRRAEQVTRRVRDFAALHYLRSGRTDGVWRAFAKTDLPDSLARTLDQYAYRGRLPFHEDESISRDWWTAALIGLGILPCNLDPVAAAPALAEAIPAMARLAKEIEDAVAPLPPYRDYLAAAPSRAR